MRQKLKSIAIKRANELFFFQMFAHCAATVVNDVPIFREIHETVSTTYFRFFFFEESRWHEQRLAGRRQRFARGKFCATNGQRRTQRAQAHYK